MALEIVAATRNRGKLVEIKTILDLPEIQILFLHDFPAIGEIPEEGETFVENALSKARAVYKRSGLISLGDDSGLCVDALGGRPGVMSARFAGENAADDTNNAMLLDEMRGVPDGERSAKFVCVVAVAAAGGKELTVRGECEGVILREGRGEHGFGYDPLFYYAPAGKTFAQMSPAEKNSISHRSMALRRLRRKLQALLPNAT